MARSARAIKVGTLRPAIVLYDEPHPLGDDIGCIQTSDIARKPDMLIIMGTSLKVHGFKKLVKDFARAVHESAPPPTLPPGPSPLKKSAKSLAGKVVFINKTAPGSEWDGIIDYHVAGETDRWVEKVVEDWKKARPQDWEIQKSLVPTADPTTSGDFHFHVVKEITNTMGAKAKGKSYCFWCGLAAPRAMLTSHMARFLSRREAEEPSQARERPGARRRRVQHHPPLARAPVVA